jgi:hypothetical protein
MERLGPSFCAALLCVSLCASALAQAEREPDANAVVVLIGEANRTPELAGVLAELLLHQGVKVQFNTQPHFEPRVLLDAGKDDTRVWVFIALDGPLRARLYFRGPLGERFLLRELALRAGLDEVGRELIGRVVETSTLALLHSSEGLNRAQAEEDIAAHANPGDAARMRESESAREERRAPDRDPVEERDRSEERDDALGPSHEVERWLLGARLLGQWTGNALKGRYGAGVELGRVLSRGEWPRVRLRVAFELSFTQTLERSAVDARVTAWPLRAGVDLGLARGVHAWLLGLSTGFDRVHTSAEHARSSELQLSEPSTQLLPASRAELRYELALSRLLLSVAALIDVPWAVTHYAVFEDGKRVRLGTPWQVRPGLVLGCGARL